ncbi:MAG: DUF2723 domain-containing protein [Myxococcota bacterium]|nr:DUF2723 domain-containing protein [Myxococcota bacterium]
MMGSLRRWLAQIAWDRGGLIGLLTLVLYVWIAPGHIVDGDNAEFSTLAALGGTAHPSGYPAYVLWLRAWSWLPAESPAHAAAIATALLGAAQMVVLHAACRAWGARPAAASIAVAIFAGAPAVLAIYTEAEVFAMNGLVVSLILWVAATGGPLRGAWRCAALGLIAGLGMANHLTCTLLAPIGVLGVVRGLREMPRGKPVGALLAVAGLVAGLTPYLYLLVAPEHAGTWGKPETLGDVLHVFLRSDYGGPGSFAANAAETYPGANLTALGETFVRTWLYIPGILGVCALGYRCARPGRAETRWGWGLLAACVVISGPALVTRFNLEPRDNLVSYVVERFHLLPMLLLVIPVAAACELVAALLERRWSGAVARLQSRALGMVLVACGFAAVVSTSLPHVLAAHAPAVELSLRNMVRSLPPGAVVIGSSDDLHSGMPYVQLVLGERPDVIYVNWAMMRSEWYRARVAARGVTFRVERKGLASVHVAHSVLASGRPLFVDRMQANILRALPHHHHGLLYRVLPPGTPAPAIEEVFELNKQLYAAFELTYPRPGLQDRWPTQIHVRYAWTWKQLALQLHEARRYEDAAWAIEAARDLGPQP